MSALINLVNQIFEIEQKNTSKGDPADLGRNMERLRHHLDELGLQYHSPLHEKYTDTRTDCVASIVGDLVDTSMYITKVIKPVVFQKDTAGNSTIVQKAVVIVEHRTV
jgi:hypothetical protein